MIKLAIVGASYLQLPLVLKAKGMGLFTICFAWKDGAVCRNRCDKFYPISILEKDSILDLCRKEKISGIISIASDLAVPTVCYVAEKLGLTGNSFESSLVSTNKYLQRRKLFYSKLQVPRFENYANITLASIVKEFHFPIVIKPVDRSGSKGVGLVETYEDVKIKIENAKKESIIGEVIIEEFIEGEEISVESISWKGSHYLLAFTDKVTTGRPHFVELEHHQPSKYWDSNLHAEIWNVVMNSLNALDIQYGACHSELMITKTGEIYVTEIGARMGGDFIGSHLVQLSTGFDFLKAIIEIALGSKPEVYTHNKRHAGVCFYTKGTEWVADFVKSKNSNIVDWNLDQLNDLVVKESAERSGYLIYCGDQKIDVFTFKESPL